MLVDERTDKFIDIDESRKLMEDLRNRLNTSHAFAEMGM